MRRIVMRKTTRRVALVGLAAIVLWVGLDLFGQRQFDLRDFDAVEVARLETDMWRSYYERRQVRLFLQLAGLLRTQFRLPFLRSHVVAFSAARAAFIFKDGSGRESYERALPALKNFYTAIRKASVTPFDPDKVAKLELEWWIVHRSRDKEALSRALAYLQAELFHLPAERFTDHGRLRAEAMLLRDARWESGMTESDWSTINGLLERSWQDLWTKVHAGSSPVFKGATPAKWNELFRPLPDHRRLAAFLLFRTDCRTTARNVSRTGDLMSRR